MSASVQSAGSIYSQLTDEELVERFKNGDSESLDFLVRIYLPKTYKRVCRQIPESDVEDVRQEILLSFIKSVGKLKTSSNFGAWFARIAARRIADYYRQTSRQKEDVVEDQPIEVDDSWKSIDDELTVREALIGMPGKYREVLSLKFLEDLSLAEISEKLGLTYEAARSRYRRGIHMLKEKVREI